MEINIQNQLIIILYSAFLGLIFGAGYDIIRIVHIILGDFGFRHPLVFVLDLLYMTVLAAGCSVFAYAFNHGMMRLYLLVPMGIGFAVYYNTAGRIVMLFSEAIVRLLRTVFHYTVVKPLCLFLLGIRLTAVWIFRRTVGALLRGIKEYGRKRYTEKQKRLIKNIVRI